ncbi:MAG TPA: MFS transporter [Phycisphaerae bacterium]|nr:MFS transporter [Phycisphaerae bacterium]
MNDPHLSPQDDSSGAASSEPHQPADIPGGLPAISGLPSTSPIEPLAREASKVGPYAALLTANYRRFVSGWFLSTLSLQMMAAALQWEIYERTGSAFALGLVGLCQALPVLAFALPAGHMADLRDRKKILLVAQSATVMVAAGLTFASFFDAPVITLYVLVVCAAIAKAFGAPARGSMFPLIVHPDIFQNAVTWNSAFFHFAATVGPILGGAILVWSGAAWPIYLLTSIGTAVFVFTLLGVKPRPQQIDSGEHSLESMWSGARYLWREKSIFAALTLDLMAVLFGGATALLPVYAKDILHVGPIGFGVLRAAPYVGAVVMALVIAHLPPFKRAGRSLLLSVAAFGLAMIAFGLSRSFALSLVCLLSAGAVDNISVVIRHVLVQTRTPDALRGRVSAVNTVFIESSNELGSFESGAVAALFGPVVSVVSGGIGTIVVVLLIAWRWPALARLKQLRDINEP